MSIMRSPEGGPLGVVTDSFVKEYNTEVQFTGTFWVEPGTTGYDVLGFYAEALC